MTLQNRIDEILDKYYAPIKLPDNNRNGLKQALTQVVKNEVLVGRVAELNDLILATDLNGWDRSMVKHLKERKTKLEQQLERLVEEV